MSLYLDESQNSRSYRCCLLLNLKIQSMEMLLRVLFSHHNYISLIVLAGPFLLDKHRFFIQYITHNFHNTDIPLELKTKKNYTQHHLYILVTGTH